MRKKFSIGRIIVYAFLFLYALVVAAPLFLMIITSLKENLEFMKAPLALPQGLNLSGYASVFSNEQFFRSILNSAVVALVSLAVSLTVSILLSYALARYRGRHVQQAGTAQLAVGADLHLHGDVDSVFHVYSHGIHQNDSCGTGRRGLY